MESRKVVIAGYARSPQTFAGKGALADVRPDDLMGQVIAGLIKKTGLDPKLVDDVKIGCAMPEGEQGLNVARHATFLAGLPDSVPAITENRFCGSSMQTIHDAAGAIAMGMADCVVAGGVESMSRVPMGGFNPMLNPKLLDEKPGAYMDMGTTAENVSRKYNISREDQEKFAVASQFKAAAAKQAGKFDDEIVPIVKADGSVVSEDGTLRPETSAEGLAKLKPAFATDGTVTAGTSSPLTDGASAVLVCSEDFAKKHGLEIMAEVVSYAATGLDPEYMGMGPVTASAKALDRAHAKLDDVKVVELNEAFAAQAVAVIREMKLDEAKVNPQGGAIALGHPLGASGARITGKAAQELHDTGKEGDLALATMCIGGGQGIATVLKKYTP